MDPSVISCRFVGVAFAVDGGAVVFSFSFVDVMVAIDPFVLPNIFKRADDNEKFLLVAQETPQICRDARIRIQENNEGLFPIKVFLVQYPPIPSRLLLYE